MFCASSQIGRHLNKFDQQLQDLIPHDKDTKQKASEKLAIIHCELNAIHPFREGNGRTIRLFLDLLAVNAGLSVIDYEKTSYKNYIQACINGMTGDYAKMQKLILRGLSRS